MTLLLFYFSDQTELAKELLGRFHELFGKGSGWYAWREYPKVCSKHSAEQLYSHTIRQKELLPFHHFPHFGGIFDCVVLGAQQRHRALSCKYNKRFSLMQSSWCLAFYVCMDQATASSHIGGIKGSSRPKSYHQIEAHRLWPRQRWFRRWSRP